MNSIFAANALALVEPSKRREIVSMDRRKRLLFLNRPPAYTKWATGIDIFEEYPEGIITLTHNHRSNRYRTAWLFDDATYLLGTHDDRTISYKDNNDPDLEAEILLTGDLWSGRSFWRSENDALAFIVPVIKAAKEYGLKPEVQPNLI